MVDIESRNNDLNRTYTTNKYDSTFMSVVRNFHLSWYILVLSWGGTALAINIKQGFSPEAENVLNIIGTVIWIWDLIYWTICTCLLTARIVLYPEEYWRMMREPNQFLVFGCVPMSAGVLGMGFVPFGPNIMPASVAFEIAYILFIIVAVFAVLTIAIVPYMMIAYQPHSLATMSTAWLLPFITLVIASAQAGVVGGAQEDLGRQKALLVAGLVMWGAGMFTAAPIIAAYMIRLFIYGFPPKQAGNSVWSIVGPIGQGCNAILILGRNTVRLQNEGVFCDGPNNSFRDGICIGPITPLMAFGSVMPGIGLVIGVFLWGVGVWWLGCATVGTLYHSRKVDWVVNSVISSKTALTALTSSNMSHLTIDADNLNTKLAKKASSMTTGVGKKQARGEMEMPFDLSWWGVVFPLGTISVGSAQLHIETHLALFRWMGIILTVALFCTAIYLHFKTARRMLKRSFWLSFAPRSVTPEMAPVKV